MAVYAGGGKKGKSPPPPPPPCQIQSAGCYKIGDVKSGFGELTTIEFAYFLPENKCKREGGCDCRGVPDNIVQETNPDDSSGACTCIAGTDWNAKARCCGDDEDDCGKISSGVLCSIDANLESASWIPSTANLGELRYVGCNKAEYISDGSTWIKCDGTFWRKTIGTSEYICIGKGRESVVECCGDGSCKSRVDGKRLSTGQSVNPQKFESEPGLVEKCEVITKTCQKPANCNGETFTADQCTTTNPNNPGLFECKKRVCSQVQVPIAPIGDGKTYYCRTDRRFVTDLDVPNSQISDKALIGKNKPTCEKANLKWTGTKCCSEADDPNEFYNDPTGIGGCFDKQAVISVNFVEGTKNSVVNYKGGFHGCVIKASKFNKDNDVLLNLIDKHTGGPLITDSDYCTTDTEKSYYCAYTEEWLQTNGADRSHLSYAPISSTDVACLQDVKQCPDGSFVGRNPKDNCNFYQCSSKSKQAAGCCAKDECWDGENCVDNQKNNPLAQPINGSRCIDGEWTISELTFTPDDEAAGYCPKTTQCLATVFGAKKCINSTEYVNDNYCEDSKWSTRTKLLALKLLRMKSGDYTIFCDSRENALNNLQYLSESNEIIANVLTGLQTNNFCVLKTGSKIISATSINQNLEDVPSSKLSALGVSDCSAALIDDGQYHSCDSTNKVWFNKRLKSFIYSTTAISVPSDQASFEDSILNPIKNIIASIKRLVTTPPFDESYVKGIKKFDRLYMAQQGSQSIKGSMEGQLKFPFFKNAVIQYSGIDTDICKFTDQFNLARKDASSGISCKKEGNNYYVLVQGSQATSINPEAIWLDLTSKLRLSGSGSASQSCFDDIKNQNEIGIDCGGVCKACISTQSICQNAQNGDLCAGLDIAYTSGYKSACCREFRLCC